jgi:hypothetical protein
MPINSFLYPGAKFITPYTVDNSCRFNDDDGAYMHKTPSSSGNQRTFTFSTWWKQGDLASSSVIFASGEADGDPNFAIYYNSSQQLNVMYYEGSALLQLITTAVYRDPGGWYHICVAIDTTQGTASNRAKIYINGSQVTSFGTETYCNQNVDISINTSSYRMSIGTGVDNGDDADGYMAETVFIDGTAYAASDFGEFDEDTPTVFKPKNVSGLTFGTNGFYLDFEDSANLGNDKNGGTDLTEVNLAATDQSSDSPTNNFCVMNSIASQAGSNASNDVITFAEGNLDLSAISSESAVGTIGVAAGKWYWEVKVITTQDGIIIGGANQHFHLDAELGYESPSSATGAKIFGYYGSNGNSFIAVGDGTSQSYGSAINSNNNIIGVALDVDSADQTCTFYLNGTTQGSLDITNLGTGEYYFPACGNWSASNCAFSFNFGNPTFSISSGNSDGNGYGNFEYAVPSGYYALCTQNLAKYGG